MIPSPRWSSTDYIKEFARKSVSSFRWQNNDVFAKCVFATLISLKKIKGINPSYLSATEKFLSSKNAFFRVFCLRFVRFCLDENVVSEVLAIGDGANNIILKDIFDKCYASFIVDLDNILDPTEVESLKRTVKSINLASMYCCWHFLNIARAYNLVEKMNDELYLLMEIELFKNRKE